MDRKLADRKAYEYIKFITGGSGGEAAEKDEHASDQRNSQRRQESKSGTLVEGSITGSSRPGLSSSLSIREKINRAFS